MVLLFILNLNQNVIDNFGDGKYKDDGRILKAEYEDFTLLNIYFLSSADSDKDNQEKKLHHKLMFYDASV